MICDRRRVWVSTHGQAGGGVSLKLRVAAMLQMCEPPSIARGKVYSSTAYFFLFCGDWRRSGKAGARQGDGFARGVFAICLVVVLLLRRYTETAERFSLIVLFYFIFIYIYISRRESGFTFCFFRHL